jgi:CubicO group peptidase (beta-lactamase class C family)
MAAGPHSSPVASGFADPGFEVLRTIFQQGLRDFGRGGAAFAVTLNGKEVVNLYGGEAAPGRPWQSQTPAVLMSVTKGLAGLCAQILFDRGMLDPNALVRDYWPEYGCNGKQLTLVRHVLTHTCGVLGLPGSNELLHWDGRGWDDLDGIAERLAGATPAWEPGSRHGYHAVTYGWLVGELVRRVSGRTLGTFFREEVAEPLAVETAIGIGPQVFREMAVVHAEGLNAQPLLLRPMYGLMKRKMRTPGNLLSSVFLGDGDRSLMDIEPNVLSEPMFLAAEVPSSNGVSSASDLARIFAVLACDGAVGDVRLLGKQAVDAFRIPVLHERDAVIVDTFRFPGAGLMHRKTVMTRSLGYAVNQFRAGEPPHFGPNPDSYGCEGAGGQVVFCDPSQRLSVAFVRSALSSSPHLFRSLVDAVYAGLEGNS